ncbi:MAG: PHP domain-containing protein [Clostridia bacterium]|nr:PHP domain-containing protein [Clostridia bacterium]
MKVTADLHTHSSASDGQYPPEELVRLAASRGLTVMALTDHDTVEGIEPAVREGRRAGMTVLPGVELGAAEHRSLHLLGYAFDPASPAITDLCRKLREGRDERKYRIIDFLKEKGVEISLEEVEQTAGGAVIARPHFAQVMVRRGHVATVREAFDRYLDTEEYQRIERFKADAATCIAAIRAAGGHASLAHPCQLKLPEEEMATLVRRLADAGLGAIECFYPAHTAQQVAFYRKLAEKNGLQVTGGSDFHGERVKPNIALAAWPLELDWLLG